MKPWDKDSYTKKISVAVGLVVQIIVQRSYICVRNKLLICPDVNWNARKEPFAHIALKGAELTISTFGSTFEKQPPNRETDAEDNAKSASNNDNDESFPDGGIEIAQSRARPVDAPVIGTAVSDAGFPTTDNLPVPFPEYPDPEVNIRIREPREYTG